MQLLPIRKLYLSAYSIVAVVGLLLVLISVSTYRNLDREERLALSLLERQGLTLIRMLEAGARSGMLMHMWQEDSVANLIREATRDEEIAYIYLLDDQGAVVHAAGNLPGLEQVSWPPPEAQAAKVRTRLQSFAGGERVYALAKRFAPLDHDAPALSMHGSPMASQHSHRGHTIVLGLRLQAYDAARRADLQHAVVMAAIVVALGTGVLFFILVLQNHRLVDRTLKETRDYARQVVASMANGLLSIDHAGRVVSCNRLVLELLGVVKSGICGVDLRTVFDFGTSGIQDVLSGSTAVGERQLQFRRADGTSIPLALTTSRLPGEAGRPAGAVIILRDLREIRQLESRVRRSEELAAIGKLAAGVAHEIRNPLSSIRGFAHFLSHALSDRPQEREYADIMIKEMDRINRVVTDLLVLAQPHTPEVESTRVAGLVDHVIRLVQGDARTARIELKARHDAPETMVSLDANQMTQVLLNLVLNALKFVPRGGSIDIATQIETQGQRLLIQVQDDGPGIAPENLDRVFDPFFTTRDTGTGLGLAIARKIVENHQGRIRVQSPPPNRQRGCRFSIAIPMASNPSTDSQPATAGPAAGRRRPHATQDPGGG
jgi:two-component system, NtrC family, sensor histidine kinase HydH